MDEESSSPLTDIGRWGVTVGVVGAFPSEGRGVMVEVVGAFPTEGRGVTVEVVGTFPSEGRGVTVGVVGASPSEGRGDSVVFLRSLPTILLAGGSGPGSEVSAPVSGFFRVASFSTLSRVFDSTSDDDSDTTTCDVWSLA